MIRRRPGVTTGDLDMLGQRLVDMAGLLCLLGGLRLGIEEIPDLAYHASPFRRWGFVHTQSAQFSGNRSMPCRAIRYTHGPGSGVSWRMCGRSRANISMSSRTGELLVPNTT